MTADREPVSAAGLTEIEEGAAAFDAMEIEPAPTNFDWLPSAADLTSLMPAIRLAAVTTTKTKPELLQVVRDLCDGEEGDKPLYAILEGFMDLDARLRSLADLAAAANSRVYLAFAKTLSADGADDASADASVSGEAL